MSHGNEGFVIKDKLFVSVSWVARFCGVCPVSFVKIRNDVTICTSRFWMIYSVLLLIVLESIYILTTIHELINTEIKPYRVLLFSNLCVLIVFNNGVLFGIQRIRTIMYCLDQIQKIKRDISVTKGVLNSKQWRIDAIFLTFLLLTLALGFFTLRVYDDWRSQPSYFRYLLYILINLMGYQFINVAMSIHSTVTIINKNLQEILTTICAECEMDNTRFENYLNSTDLKIPMKSINTAIDLIGITDKLYPDIEITQKIRKAEKIRLLTNSFVSTSNILRKLNASDSFILMLLFVVFIIDLAITAQNFSVLLRRIDGDHSLGLYHFVQISWFASHVLRMLLLVEPCYRAQVEVSNARFLVGRIMCFMTSRVEPLYDELDIFFKQLLLNNFTYTALGICDIGRSLISTIIGASTTILVLSYQML